jgi:hypothetical protein
LNLDNMMKLVGEFSIIDQKIYSIAAWVFDDFIIKRTLHGGLKIFILSSSLIFSIFAQPFNILYICIIQIYIKSCWILYISNTFLYIFSSFEKIDAKILTNYCERGDYHLPSQYLS